MKDPELEIKDDLFKNDYCTKSYEANGFLNYDDFLEFGLKLELVESKVRRIIDDFATHNPKVESLVHQSFLSSEAQEPYKSTYLEN